METDPTLREVKMAIEILMEKFLVEKMTEIDAFIEKTYQEAIKNIKTPIAGVDFPLPKNGEDYKLTPKDKLEIANLIDVPIIEKVVERTEVVKEQPIITEITKQETKEVAKYEEPLAIADKLNTLEEKVDRKVIKGLDKELFAMKKNISEAKRQKGGGGGSGGGGYPVKTYDISSQLNGVLKTFTIPRNKYVIDVKIGTIPPLRPIIDYTYNTTSVTFTEEIDPTTYLSAGLSAIVIYAED